MSEVDQKNSSSIESVLGELTRSESNASVIVNTAGWNQLPLLLWGLDGTDETTIIQLLSEISRILTLVAEAEVPLASKRLLHSSLSALLRIPTLPKKGRLPIKHSLTTLESLPDGPLVLLVTDEVRSMELALSRLERQASELTHQNQNLEMEIEDLRKVEEQKEQAERDNEKLLDVLKRTLKALGESREEKEKSERAKREMVEQMEEMRILMRKEVNGTEFLIHADSLSDVDERLSDMAQQRKELETPNHDMLQNDEQAFVICPTDLSFQRPQLFTTVE
ncbi:hypothetical protein BLNAU_7411 [Blattamonas nauphoetae]|uniref:Uncharacterized protein n=1 Tax=Blattamonas nauphoetae TaxID=2049346 RepID=A0ABQ9Y1A7_9EUKA|nr:hypothetical protein BLNAU_7411 [Blattamonas nauphoetae]